MSAGTDPDGIGTGLSGTRLGPVGRADPDGTAAARAEQVLRPDAGAAHYSGRTRASVGRMVEARSTTSAPPEAAVRRGAAFSAGGDQLGGGDVEDVAERGQYGQRQALGRLGDQPPDLFPRRRSDEGRCADGVLDGDCCWCGARAVW